jgi:hypothetical protein
MLASVSLLEGLNFEKILQSGYRGASMFASILNTQTQKTIGCICALCLFDGLISSAKAALLGTIPPPGFLILFLAAHFHSFVARLLSKCEHLDPLLGSDIIRPSHIGLTLRYLDGPQAHPLSAWLPRASEPQPIWLQLIQLTGSHT